MVSYNVECSKCGKQHHLFDSKEERNGMTVLTAINGDVPPKVAGIVDGNYMVCRCGMSILIKSIVIVQVIQRMT